MTTPTGPGSAHGSVLALGKPNDSLLTVLIVGVVVLLLLFLLLRHLVRKRGGWRRFRRRLGRELTLTRRAFGEPLRGYRRHRRGVRALARHLSDPRGGLLVRRLLDAAATALADAPGAVPHAVRTEAGLAAVQIAARPLPEPPAPWEPADEPGPQRWELPLAEADGLPQGRPRTGARIRPLPVAVGMADDACVHLDLTAGPRLITVEGDTAARTRLLQALAAQLDRPGSGASVMVTDGVHPQYRGERLDAVLRELEETEEGPEGAGEFDESGRAATTVVVCAAPGSDQARRLGALAASGAVVCLIDGRVAGHSWALRVDGRGRVVAPELELDVDSSPLGGAVAVAVRADRRRLRREASPRRGTPAPPRSAHREPRPREAEEIREIEELREIEAARPVRTARQTEATRTLPAVEEPPTLPEAEALREETPAPALQAPVPARTTTASELLAEPAVARDRTTAASSGVRED
ncbi:hypothetical protein [Streptomyces griseiscabiei]|uniref:Secreted protein n=1 Tax=Streptomyces griseiscabiei TaxID=2993540 RepID=A0ABU4LH74_9ACTN|nr:hypothetical protein [Streptomyces griseiscabiei]MBZ3904217.1 hypothetical protein [Streptomyces griseiscabiei]MDX2914800.1 hypothetical protein [Streptomyces griseiscabiei]